ncbi:MAG: bi-domain-containing oxidoreductase [Aliivibrio sp.]|uniref:bi-domain-containing oxidoreductase n=1 Tax=Aliivibrio sp. TaxID=1872443 RepID=UPI001A4D7FC5|nr:bi-domain-containing oxidoreductase [Aliivibrio sp.]
MKQILQNMSTGETTIVTAPAPNVSSGTLLIESKVSLISAGTERMLVDFGNASLISKARKQPEKVKMVLDKVKTDGLMPTIDAVKSKLEQPLPLGYCNVGTVIEVGSKVHGFKEGDRVVSNGPHADVVRVVENLCAKIPDNVTDEEASFAVLAAIGLQGIRLLKPTLGEAIVVIGAGLIGLAAIQMLLANGCRVLAVDFDGKKLDLAKKFGAEIYNLSEGDDPIAAGMAFSRGVGVDGVLIAASTQSNDPVSQAANMCRSRGRIILVGVTGLALNRAEFYNKELSFQVSCSYGPGRYDVSYEDNGNDYPIGFVRWTEQRNFEAVLDLLSAGKIDVKPLISHRFLFDDATAAYSVLTEDKSVLGIVLEYSSEDTQEKLIREITLAKGETQPVADVVVGFIGAGNYASRVLIPAFKETEAKLHTIVTSGGVNGVIHGNKNGFSYASTDIDALLSHTEINTISIVTQHNTHAKFVQKALENNKNVFVEKPLAIHMEDLEAIEQVYREKEKAGNPPVLMVGFNRRFSPQIQKMKSLLRGICEPKSFIMTMNAGAIPVDHWTQDPEIGGGRIIGEACHFVDLMRFLADSPIVSMQALCMGNANTDTKAVTEDKASITLGFADGSFGTIHYLANGASSFPKERIEVFCEGKVLQLDNFRKLKAFGWKGFKKMNLWAQDKGQKGCAQAFVNAVKKGTEAPISSEEIFEVARVTIEIASQLRKQR